MVGPNGAPLAGGSVIKGGRVACGGIHMSNIPQFPYRILCEERQILSVANFTQQGARDFRSVASNAQVGTETAPYPLEAANEALADLRSGRLQGGAVLVQGRRQRRTRWIGTARKRKFASIVRGGFHAPEHPRHSDRPDRGR